MTHTGIDALAADLAADGARRPGGLGFNAALVAAQRGCRAGFLGVAAGGDGAEAVVLDRAARGGLRARCLVDRASRTTLVCPVVDPASGERAIFWASDGAAPSPAFAARALPALFADDAWLRACRVLYVPGWFLLHAGAADGVVGLARRRPALAVAVNLAGVDCVRTATAALLAVIDVAAIVFGNEAEFAALAAVKGEAGAVVAATSLGTRADGRARVVAATFGPDPTVVVDGAAARSYAVPRADRVADTTGAGDAFAGAFLAATLDGAPLDERVRCGHKAAAHVLARDGPAPDPDFH